LAKGLFFKEAKGPRPKKPKAGLPNLTPLKNGHLKPGKQTFPEFGDFFGERALALLGAFNFFPFPFNINTKPPLEEGFPGFLNWKGYLVGIGFFSRGKV